MKDKKKYVKPKLESFAYAQFENVFTACDKNSHTNNQYGVGCSFYPDINENSHPSWTAHFGGQGSC